MTWLTLSIISVITLAIANLLRKILMKDETSDTFTYSFVFQIMSALIVGIFAFAYGFVMPPIGEFPINFALTTALYAGATLFLFKAYSDGEASRITILGSSSTLWVIVGAMLFLGESFDLTKTVGVALILLGVILVSLKRESLAFSRGDVFALGSATCYGLAFVNDAFILREANALSYTSIAFLLPGLLMLAVKPRLVRNLKQFLKPRVLAKMSVFSLFYSVAAITVYMAYQKGGGAAQLGSISQSVVILTVILAAIFLGERENLAKKSIAAILTTIGVILLR